jgi:hypothetical protein
VIAGVVDTGEKFIAGDNDTGHNFITGENDTGVQLYKFIAGDKKEVGELPRIGESLRG